MQLVIPMAGYGERFRREGYDRPKPLVEIEGRPMIVHVLERFRGFEAPVLLASAEHLAEPAWRLREIVAEVRPDARIVAVDPHRRGPVHTLVAGLEAIELTRPVTVSVCDLDFEWDGDHFRAWFAASEADAAVVVYRGFHPHFLHDTHYGFLREEGGWCVEIREKHHFTDDPIRHREPCSNGVYAWRSGALLAESVRAVHGRPELAIAGEHYPAQAMQLLVEAGRAVAVYDTPTYAQWGNPRDLREYAHHAEAFGRRVGPRSRGPRLEGTLLVPMAGLGERFTRAGFTLPKPLVPVCGAPMAVQAAADLPDCAHQVFVVRADMTGVEDVASALTLRFPEARIVRLAGPTDGQARTVALGLSEAGVDPERPLVIGTCDNGLAWDGALHAEALERADVLVWAMRGHPGARVHPGMYGWVRTEGDRVRGVSVKVPLDDPATDPIIVGTFSFRRAGDFERAFARQVERDARVRGELYVDTLVEDALALGLDVRLFVVDAYDGWGTPDDLATFTYWQGWFHRRAGHPYRLHTDPAVSPQALPALLDLHTWQPPAPLTPRSHP